MTKSAIIGTADYIAPEQIRASGDVDSRADIYSLGVMAYEMLTGHLPYAGENVATVIVGHLQLPIPDPRLIVPDLSVAAASAVQQAMAKDPNERFATASEFVRELGDDN
jgi:serine/threonine protein kinase